MISVTHTKNVTLALLGCVGNTKYQSNNRNDKTI